MADFQLDYKQKVFCDLYVATLDFAGSCSSAKVNKIIMREYLNDPESQIAQYVASQIDVFIMCNSILTQERIKHKLGQIVLDGEPAHVIQAAKLLLGFDESEDKTKEFKDLIKAVQQKD